MIGARKMRWTSTREDDYGSIMKAEFELVVSIALVTSCATFKLSLNIKHVRETGPLPTQKSIAGLNTDYTERRRKNNV